jgi:competence protein ComEC
VRFNGLSLLAILMVAAIAGVRTHEASQSQPADASSLQVFFIDVEGGAATLVVSPAGESLLIDSGNPGGRDGARIPSAARAQAHLQRIDHYVTTHWHRDHVGGIGDLAELIPVTRYYGHTIPDPMPPDVQMSPMAIWRQLAGQPTWLHAGEKISLKGSRSGPDLLVDVLAGEGTVLGEPAGSPQVRACEKGHEAKDEDQSDNARSLAFRLSYGNFDLFAGGDLTWNVEHKLVCPRPVFPTPVDAYLVNHHGLDSSNNPALLRALEPTVAIVNNGPRKGAEPRTMRLLLDELGPTRVFQLHRNVRDGALNTDAPLVANDTQDCNAAFVQLTVPPAAKRYTVAIPAKNGSWTFEVK